MGYPIIAIGAFLRTVPDSVVCIRHCIKRTGPIRMAPRSRGKADPASPPTLPHRLARSDPASPGCGIAHMTALPGPPTPDCRHRNEGRDRGHPRAVWLGPASRTALCARPPRAAVAVPIDAATGDCHALDPPDFPPGLSYPQPRDARSGSAPRSWSEAGISTRPALIGRLRRRSHRPAPGRVNCSATTTPSPTPPMTSPSSGQAVVRAPRETTSSCRTRRIAPTNDPRPDREPGGAWPVGVVRLAHHRPSAPTGRHAGACSWPTTTQAHRSRPLRASNAPSSCWGGQRGPPWFRRRPSHKPPAPP